MMNTSLHILVVDDDRRMTRTLFDILNLEGFQVTQANSGEEAVEIARTTHFDCVLSDVKMSGINGVEMSQALQVIQPELPVVLMTAYAREGLVEQGYRPGLWLPWKNHSISTSY
jgi:two-component system response regulator HydG